MRLPKLDPQRPPRVLVIGDLMLDRTLWGTCERVSAEAPVPIVQVQRETQTLGGAGNVVANLCSLGASVALIALVGADARDSPLERLLRERGVGTDGLIHDPDRPTTIKTRVLAAHHQLLRFDVERALPCSDAHAERILAGLRERAASSDVVVLSDYAKGTLSAPLVRELIRFCNEARLPILVDPKGREYAHYRGATLLTPNRKEAAAATGLMLDQPAGIAAAGRKLMQELALESCLITLSEDGMALFEPDALHHLATEAREVFDVSGAGDTVIAAIAFALGGGSTMLEACHFANRAAGVVVGKLGAATVTLDELVPLTAAEPMDSESKILTRAALLAEVARLRSAGRRLVFTNGCFDILHAGHVQYLTRAARLGDALIVGLNSDDSVRRLKGVGRPINRERDRALVLAALSCVQHVTLFEEETPLELIARIQPDVLVKGGDYQPDDIVGGVAVRAAGGRVEVLPYVAGQSTTQILARKRSADA